MGLFCIRLYGINGLVRLKDMVLLVLQMRLILPLPWKIWTVWVPFLLWMHPFPVTSISTATYKTKCHAGKYVGNRPIKLRKSTWKNRIDFEALEKGKVSSQPFSLFWPHPVFFYMYHVLTFVVLIFHRLNHRRKSNRRKEVFFTSETDKLCMFIVAVSISEKVVWSLTALFYPAHCKPCATLVDGKSSKVISMQ